MEPQPLRYGTAMAGALPSCRPPGRVHMYVDVACRATVCGCPEETAARPAERGHGLEAPAVQA